MSTPQWSLCTRELDEAIVGGIFDGQPKVCGARAAGPHPDPKRGYREPLCAVHLRDAEADLAVERLEHAGMVADGPDEEAVDPLDYVDPRRPALLGIPFDEEAFRRERLGTWTEPED